MAHELYRIVVRVQMNRVEQSVIGAQRMEKILTTQVTEGFGEGQTPRDACEAAFAAGIQSYVEGLSGLTEPTREEKEKLTEGGGES